MGHLPASDVKYEFNYDVKCSRYLTSNQRYNLSEIIRRYSLTHKMSSCKHPKREGKVYKKMPMDVSIHLRYLHQDLGLKLEDLLRRYKGYSKTTIFRHAKKPISDTVLDKRKLNKGRPKKLSVRTQRSILRQIPNTSIIAIVYRTIHQL